MNFSRFHCFNSLEPVTEISMNRSSVAASGGENRVCLVSHQFHQRRRLTIAISIIVIPGQQSVICMVIEREGHITHLTVL